MTSGTCVSYCCGGIRGTRFSNSFHINIKYFIVSVIWTWLPSDLFIFSSGISITSAISIVIVVPAVVAAAWIGVHINWDFISASPESIASSHHVFKGGLVLMSRGLALAGGTGVLRIKAPTVTPAVCSKSAWV